MNQDILNAMFKQSRDQYERALRWTALAVIMLLGFHLLTFSPFINTERQLSEVQAENARLTKRQNEVTGLEAALEKLRAEAVDRIGVVLEQMFAVLRLDFNYLSGQVTDIRQGREEWQPDMPSSGAAVRLPDGTPEDGIPMQYFQREAPDLQFAYPDEVQQLSPPHGDPRFQQQLVPSHTDPRLQQERAGMEESLCLWT